jgi:hypothetical protein
VPTTEPIPNERLFDCAIVVANDRAVEPSVQRLTTITRTGGRRIVGARQRYVILYFSSGVHTVAQHTALGHS